MNTIIAIGSILGMLSVIIGAFGAHALKGKFAEEKYELTFETGVRYQMYHSLAIFLVGLLMGQLGEIQTLIVATYLFIGGIILFSGSLYMLSILGIRKFGAITPLGGLLFIAGWVCVLIAVL
ncbi:MAG: DUF423 domain-containing protein [Solibacillus sp.]|uniref:DUF423 domain-containing protein n=1 Tax=unclassified Solibacillus TaxID=2637870 RepID=UPI0030FCB4D6